MDVKRKPVSDAPALGKRAAEDAAALSDASKKRGRKSKLSSQPIDAENPIKLQQDGVEAFAAPPQPLLDASLAETVPQEMVLTAESSVPVEAQLVVEGLPPPPPPAKPRKGRRVRKTNLEKMEILHFVDQGGSQGAAAEKFGVSRTAVTKMVKERAAIASQALVESSTSSRKVLQYQHKLSVIEDMLYKWQMQVELDTPTLKITGDLLQSKAMEFRNKILADYSSELPEEIVLSLTDFKASNGWLHRYMQRRSIRSFPKQHEAAAMAEAGEALDRASSDERVQRIRDLLMAVPLACVWNLDQLTLRYRTTSTRLDLTVNLDARSHDRISVAMAVSGTGEKLRLQVVGKDPNPASLKDVDTLATFGIQYRDHCRATHDSHAIIDLIQAMNLEAKARKEVWYLILDSSTAHVAAAHALNPSGSHQNGFRFEDMVLFFLPPGSASNAQPLHHDIFRSFRLRFRHEMLQTLVYEYEQSTKSSLLNGGPTSNDATVFDVHAHTHLRNTLSWLQKAWETIPTAVILQAWSSCLNAPVGVIPNDEETATALIRESDNELEMYTALLSALTKASALQKAMGLDAINEPEQLMVQLLEFDKSEANGSDEFAKDDEIVVESLSAQGLLRDGQRVLESVAKVEVPPIPSVTDASSEVARLLHFVAQNNDTILTLAERRTGRANLLILQRLLLKARERERERDQSATDFTV